MSKLCFEIKKKKKKKKPTCVFHQICSSCPLEHFSSTIINAHFKMLALNICLTIFIFPFARYQVSKFPIESLIYSSSSVVAKDLNSTLPFYKCNKLFLCISSKSVSKHFLNCKEVSATAVFNKAGILLFFSPLNHNPRNLAPICKTFEELQWTSGKLTVIQDS